MDFIRFLSPQRYGSSVPLRHLSFRVTVYRALVVEEDNLEVLCCMTIPWNEKRYSPQEQLDIYTELQLSVKAIKRADPNGASGAPLVAPTHAAADALLTVEQLVGQLRRPESCLFTRPPAEDYIDVGEEDCPVDPPQGPSRLAPVVLRQHRKDHQPNSNMYFMWASGTLTNGSEHGGSEARTDGTPSVVPLRDDLVWSGTERVMCTITSEQNEHFFTAKPSLYEVHTLMVDSLHIYSFTVDAIVDDAIEGSFPSETVMCTTADEVRCLAGQVGRALSQLTQSKEVVARRFLKEAALMLPDNFSGAQRGQFRRGSLASTETMNPLPLLRPNLMRSAPASCASGTVYPRHGTSKMFEYYVFGVLERCLGVLEATVFLRCEFVRDGAGSGGLCPDAADEYSSPVLTTQLAYAGRVAHDEVTMDVDHIFNVPFEQRYVDDYIPASPLRLAVTAFTMGVGGADQQAPVGYASVSLPVATPGRHELRAPLWTPHKTGVEFLRSSLVGGQPSLVDSLHAGPPRLDRMGVAVKQGMVADTSGTLHLTVNVLKKQVLSGAS